MAIDKDILDRLLADYKNPEDLTGENGVLRQLTKALMERALEAEMATHLGYEKHDPTVKPSDNRRNGKSKKTLKGDFGEVEITTPRDREATFEPRIIPKGQTRMAGLDTKILSMYARGMTTRDIQGHLEEIYGVEVSPTLISNVTDAVLEEVRTWQGRPLETVYPIVFLDALVVKMREEGTVQNRAVYVAIAITMDGHKEVLGLWTSAHEGAKFWLSVLTELKTRGVEDIFVACVDGLKGFPQAIETAYPKTTVQLCIVHMVRASLRYVSWKDARAVVADLKLIYRAASRENAEQQLELFALKWDAKYRSISQLWRRHWEQIVPFFAFPAEIRKVHDQRSGVALQKVIKTRVPSPMRNRR
jgi:putative transposase